MKSDALELFRHYYQDNGQQRTLILLHGTGGDEKDLLPIVDDLERKWNFLGLRGNVVEAGMNRFFRRFSVDKFDEASIREEATKLEQFLQAWIEKHKDNCQEVAYLGYSNGGNMIVALALLRPQLVAKAVVLHGLLPMEVNGVDLLGKAFLVSYGKNDMMIPAIESEKLIDRLEVMKAQVEVVAHQGGHEIRHGEVEAIQKFLE
jgi:predicted esterase